MLLIILYIWFNFNWSTLSGTGNMLAPENSVGPMCDLEGRPKIKRMTLFCVLTGETNLNQLDDNQNLDFKKEADMICKVIDRIKLGQKTNQNHTNGLTITQSTDSRTVMYFTFDSLTGSWSVWPHVVTPQWLIKKIKIIYFLPIYIMTLVEKK